MTAKATTSEPGPLLTPAEVAAQFRVDPRTVGRWAKAGKLTCVRTLGGHRRYRESEVRALLGNTECDACHHHTGSHDLFGCSLAGCDCTQEPNSGGGQ